MQRSTGKGPTQRSLACPDRKCSKWFWIRTWLPVGNLFLFTDSGTTSMSHIGTGWTSTMFHGCRVIILELLLEGTTSNLGGPPSMGIAMLPTRISLISFLTPCVLALGLSLWRDTTCLTVSPIVQKSLSSSKGWGIWDITVPWLDPSPVGTWICIPSILVGSTPGYGAEELGMWDRSWLWRLDDSGGRRKVGMRG